MNTHYDQVFEDDAASVVETQPEPIGSASVEDAVAEEAGTGDKKLSRKEWKNLLRLYFTVRRAVVQQCGHKIDAQGSAGPRNNCEACWFAYFNNNGEMVQTVDEMIQKHGSETVVRMRGLKFLKNFRKFMSTVARFKAQVEADAEAATQTGKP